MELSRYIHLNPVRAGLVGDPSQYPWSSYLAYVSRDRRWKWLQTGFILAQLGSEEREVQRRYQSYIMEGVGKHFEGPLGKVVASTLLGSEKFIEWVRQRWVGKVAPHRDVPSLRRITLWPGLPMIKMEAERVFGKENSESRRIALYLSHRLSGLPLGEIGEFFGEISPSAVSQNTRRVEVALKENKELREKINSLNRILSQ